MKDKQGVTMNRRGFLKGAVALGGAATASVISQRVMAGEPVEEKSVKRSDDKPKGYHVTPHILDYYEKARF